MDPTIWGPKLWNIMLDVAHSVDMAVADDRGRVALGPQNRRYVRATEAFFQSLGTVLPCKHCRDSYAVFTSQNAPLCLMDNIRNDAPRSHQVTLWVWNVKNLVNAKLDKPQHLGFDTLMRRLMTWKQNGQGCDLVDFVSILVLNLDNRHGADKQTGVSGLVQMLDALRVLSPIIPWGACVSQIVAPCPRSNAAPSIEKWWLSKLKVIGLSLSARTLRERYGWCEARSGRR